MSNNKILQRINLNWFTSFLFVCLLFFFLFQMLNVAIAAHFHTPESLLLRRDALFRLPATELDSAGKCAKCKLLAETDNADQQQAGQARHQLSWVEREARSSRVEWAWPEQATSH